MLRAPLAALVLVVGAIALVGSARADPRFDPSFSVALTQPAPQAPSELTLSFKLESGYQLSTAVIYVPFDWGVVPGDQIPVGARVATTDSVDTFGLINSPCNQALAVHFDLFNATLDPAQTVSFKDGDDASSMPSAPAAEPGTGGYVYTEESDGYGTPTTPKTRTLMEFSTQ
jgi:hypothetical protein